MDRIKEVLKHFKEGISQELIGLKQLSGAKLEKFIEVFNVKYDIVVYYNDFNIVFIDKISHEQLQTYLQIKDLILTLDFPEFNCHMWVYKYYNDTLFNDYLSE